MDLNQTVALSKSFLSKQPNSAAALAKAAAFLVSVLRFFPSNTQLIVVFFQDKSIFANLKAELLPLALLATLPS